MISKKALKMILKRKILGNS